MNLKETLSAGFSASQWKVQLARLKSTRAHLENQKKQSITALGKQAWDARVQHPAIADSMAALQALETERSQAQATLQARQADLQQQTAEHTRLKNDFSARIAAIETRRKADAAGLSQSVAAQRAAQTRLEQVQRSRQFARQEVERIEGLIAQLAQSSAPDREAQKVRFQQTLAAQQKTLQDSEAQLPAINEEIQKRTLEQPALREAVQAEEQQLAALQQEQRSQLGPLEARIQELKKDVQALNTQIQSLGAKMTPLFAPLGALVEQARPQSPALQAAYAQIDGLKAQIQKLDGEIDFQQTRLNTVDPQTTRRFYLIIAAAAAVLIGLFACVVLSATLIFHAASNSSSGSDDATFPNQVNPAQPLPGNSLPANPLPTFDLSGGSDDAPLPVIPAANCTADWVTCNKSCDRFDPMYGNPITDESQAEKRNCLDECEATKDACEH